MKFKSFAKKGLVAVTVTGALLMVATGVQYKGDLIGGLNDKLAKLESMLGTYSSRYQKDKDTIAKLQDEIAKLKEQLATSNGDKSDLQDQLDEAEAKIAKYQADLTDLAGALGIEMDETMGFDTAEKYEKLKSAINDEIEALKANKVENEAELKAVADILGCAKDENGNYTGENDISTAVQSLFDYYDEAQAEVTKLEGELEKANGLVTSLQAELDKANKEIKRLEGIIAQYEKDLEGANTKAQKIIDGKQTEVNEIKGEPSNPGETESGNNPEQTPVEGEQPTDPVDPPADGEQQPEKTEKELAKEKLTGTARTLADNGYQVGDILDNGSGNYYLYTFADCADKVKDTLGLADVSTQTPRYYTNALNITAQQLADLNHWANL